MLLTHDMQIELQPAASNVPVDIWTDPCNMFYRDEDTYQTDLHLLLSYRFGAMLQVYMRWLLIYMRWWLYKQIADILSIHDKECRVSGTVQAFFSSCCAGSGTRASGPGTRLTPSTATLYIMKPHRPRPICHAFTGLDVSSTASLPSLVPTGTAAQRRCPCSLLQSGCSD